MIVMGIDPGLATVGYGVVQTDGRLVSVVSYGIISTPAGVPLPNRLNMIYKDMQELIVRFTPDTIAFEELFFFRNVTTALAVGHARGVALVAAVQGMEKDDIYEYTPMQIKQAVCGYGHADKRQVQEMVKTLLNLDKIPRPDDAADALALAICHAQAYQSAAQFRIR